MNTYIIVTGRGLEVLAQKVNDKMTGVNVNGTGGYVPVGGPFLLKADEPRDAWYGQAMILKGCE